MKKYARVWWRMAVISFANVITTKIDSVGYVLGKIIRLVGFFIFLNVLYAGTGTFAGYSKNEAMLFFLTFYVLDVGTQVLFRGVYAFRHMVVRGDFDFFLIRPLNALFLIMSRIIDVLDVAFMVPILALWGYVVMHVPGIDAQRFASYVLLGCLSVVMIGALHIVIVAVTLFTTENQHAIWLYRELTRVGQFPPQVFPKALQAAFTFVVPIIVIMAFPTRALLGQFRATDAFIACGMSVALFVFSLVLWKMSVKKYSSASS